MTSTNPDQMQPLGTLPDLDFSTDTPVYMDRPVHRDYDHVIIPSARLDRYGRNCLRALLDMADNEIARMRLRDLDLAEHDIDPGWLRDGLHGLGFGWHDYHGQAGDLDYLSGIDWAEVGRRLDRERAATYSNVRRLYALLTADETPATETPS